MKIVDLFRKFLLYLLKLVNGPEEQQPALTASKPPATIPVDAGGSVSPTMPPVSASLATSAISGALAKDSAVGGTVESVKKIDLADLPAVESLSNDHPLAALAVVEKDPVKVATSSPEVREPVELPSPIPVKKRPTQDAAFTILEPGIATIPVRRFFARLTVREATPITQEAWPMLPVEQFFLSLSNPAIVVISGRGPAVMAPKALQETFAEFVWD